MCLGRRPGLDVFVLKKYKTLIQCEHFVFVSSVKQLNKHNIDDNCDIKNEKRINVVIIHMLIISC